MRVKSFIFSTIVGFTLLVPARYGWAESSPGNDHEKRISEMERKLGALMAEVRELREELAAEKATSAQKAQDIARLRRSAEEATGDGLHFGGYGEMHANFVEGNSGDKFDIHRLVLYLGYDFSDWIRLHSETELEHAFVADDDGEISIEQLHVDFLLNDFVNFRVGRVLTPVGIVNKKHEPPTFNGVERPSFAKSIVPTTWSSDGIGIFGELTPALQYELYGVAGLDGSGFSAKDGIRGGRIKERPSWSEPAFTARLDYFPFVQFPASMGQTLRLGASTYIGGLDNGNKGSDPGLDADLQLFSADFEYTVAKLDFRGAVALIDINGADRIGGGVAEEILGSYVEGAFHFLPDSWKTGKLAKSDAVVFVRYDDIDTQHAMPAGVAADPSGDRQEYTIGLGFLFTPSFVVKLDYQIRKDATSDDPDNLFNLGVGWQF